MRYVITLLNSRPLVLSALLAGVLFFVETSLCLAEEPLQEAMKAHLACYQLPAISLQTQDPVIQHRDICLASVYGSLGGKPLWVTMEGPGQKAEILFSFLQNAADEGLNPEDYDIHDLDMRWQKRDVNNLVQLDTALTYAAVKYMHDVQYGRISAFNLDPQLFPEAGDVRFDPVLAMRHLLEAEDLTSFLRELPPQNAYYIGLKKGLSFYRELVGTPWELIGKGDTLRVGDTDPRIVQIRKRLALLLAETSSAGDAFQQSAPTGDEDTKEIYDPEMERQVRFFQSVYGLEVDGVIGTRTIAAFNVSPERRIEAIRLNMARWRWLDHLLGDDYVLVNIANFSMECYRGGKLQLRLPVIVGMLQHQTPVFSSSIRYVEFNPYWNIPTSIAVHEELPRLRKDPQALVERSIRLYSSWSDQASELDSTMIDWKNVSAREMGKFKLRQDPGPGNALGRLKFVFPNQYSVYIHDTPGKNLFNQSQRFFSHGCIRVSHPERFAAFVLQGSQDTWDAASINDVIKTGKQKVVHLASPVPIHITYQTVWLDNDGRIHFSKDIYDRDTKLAPAFFQHES